MCGGGDPTSGQMFSFSIFGRPVQPHMFPPGTPRCLLNHQRKMKIHVAKVLCCVLCKLAIHAMKAFLLTRIFHSSARPPPQPSCILQTRGQQTSTTFNPLSFPGCDARTPAPWRQRWGPRRSLGARPTDCRVDRPEVGIPHV